ncbi:MAG: metallophosphoesterase, partial [Clostridia bacterium]
RFGKSIIPKDALESVRIKLGIFQQRYIGSIIILMGTTVYGAVSVVKNFYSASVNLENILSMSDLWILSFGVFICIKNGIRVARCSSFLSPNSSNDYKKYKITIIFSSVIFWAIALIIAVLLDLFTSLSAYVSNFLIATACVYTAFFLLFNQINGKNHFAEKIKLSKKRVISASVAILLICAVQVMNSASWWIQPYVSMIPSVMHPTSKISYDSTTGVYSITKNSTDFKVLQLTDIHLGGSAFSTEKDLLALKAVYTLIQRTVPDLVIVTGDLVFPVGISSFSLNNYTPIMQFALFMRNIGIPWAFTYGNHDTEFVATHNDKQLNSLFETFSYEKTQNLLYSSVQPKISGRNNQLIKILNPDGSINQALFLLDSNSYAGGKINNYDYIHDDQVNWYADCVSSLMFCHIPLREYRDAYNLYINKSDEVKYFFGKIGEENNSICCSQYQSKIFDKITELKSTKGIFVGHDHYNNISLEYKGVRLTYGMSIDYLVMPEIDKKTEQRGGTLITLHSDSSFDISQVRLSDLK